jgi:hypothetical protein
MCGLMLRRVLLCMLFRELMPDHATADCADQCMTASVMTLKWSRPSGLPQGCIFHLSVRVNSGFLQMVPLSRFCLQSGTRHSKYGATRPGRKGYVSIADA